jgi:hypothetical protein
MTNPSPNQEWKERFYDNPTPEEFHLYVEQSTELKIKELKAIIISIEGDLPHRHKYVTAISNRTVVGVRLQELKSFRKILDKSRGGIGMGKGTWVKKDYVKVLDRFIFGGTFLLVFYNKFRLRAKPFVIVCDCDNIV